MVEFDGELPVEPPTEQPIESAPPEAPAVETTPEQPENRDEAALALQRQIEELKRSEEMQRQQQAVLQQPQPVTREQKLALWRQSGLSEEEAHFLQRNPEMIDHPQITGFAVSQAEQAGYQRGSDGHFDAVKKIFDEQFNGPQAESPAMPTPKFFRPPPPPAPARPSNLVSAPVSRTVPDGSPRPRGKVTLSPDEQEAARISGVSLEEYAKEKARYQGMKASGEYRDNRDQN